MRIELTTQAWWNVGYAQHNLLWTTAKQSDGDWVNRGLSLIYGLRVGIGGYLEGVRDIRDTKTRDSAYGHIVLSEPDVPTRVQAYRVGSRIGERKSILGHAVRRALIDDY